MIALIFLTAMILVSVGVAIGVIVVVSLGIRREERDHSLETDAEDRITRGARRVTGLSCSRLRLYMLGHHRSFGAGRSHSDVRAAAQRRS